MADEERGKDSGEGPFLLGKSYEEVGPELGRLYEARHGWTGRAALTLLPGAGVDWRPEGAWELRVYCRPGTSSMSLTVVRSPDSAQVSELTNVFVQMTAALTRVEDNPKVQAHIARGAVRPWGRWAACVAAGAAVLALGVWIQEVGASMQSELTSWDEAGKRPSQLNAPILANTGEPSTTSIAYPLPYEPFRNQAKAPCRPDLGEVEINGGCWVTLERRPPCTAVQAEYQGKCYMPVSKDRGRPPQSAKP
ncbi:hypothetical protein D187_010385 [Cystobacter fuscus DSM 2262]|uniref:Uncharacterized protein n=1 Tax=Cystobacter fuscus (strain ATCC 25194 / DSM 2262 / NBRC 100088 / M29) TaxID=1242864 RepID=S9PFD1_CYSF2|nr:hypothetical protein [Cystobacter fuscus]EPX61766.1 hypothetical protein D187_010385 [Cystobacter fuscus DSM 2262]